MGAARIVVALISGTIFGLGLAISGMMNPEKVIGFLDVAGDWDPTLAFVMGGALLVTVPAFRLVLSRGRPVLDRSYSLPTKTDPDARLVGGAALFGVGWGLVGFCPGPAVAAMATGIAPVFAFVAAMLVGMLVYRRAFGVDAGSGKHEPRREESEKSPRLDRTRSSPSTGPGKNSSWT